VIFAVPVVALPDHHQTIFLPVGQWFEEDGIHHAEHGAVGADADGQREDGDCRKGGFFRESAHGVAQVLPERLDQGDAVHSIDLLADLRTAPQFALRGCTRFVWRQAARDILSGFDF
jgi:hypothetical protein